MHLLSVLTPEEPPRWPALTEILSEIRAEVAAAAAPSDETGESLPPPVWPEKVLIVASDQAACRRIREVCTTHGGPGRRGRGSLICTLNDRGARLDVMLPLRLGLPILPFGRYRTFWT